jgi:NAD(P)H-dependent flavin oxidoreductase YrpB (nitropropane dioxygenase family)
MQTPLCELLGMTHPGIQASNGGISCPALAAAVSNAEGLGARERLRDTHALTGNCIRILKTIYGPILQ